MFHVERSDGSVKGCFVGNMERKSCATDEEAVGYVGISVVFDTQIA